MVNFQKLVLFLFVLSLALNSVGEEIKVIGKITDQATGEEIAYAHIILLDENMGTCSNQFGEFSFNFPDTLRKKSLKFSSIGYSSKIIDIENLNDTILFVELEPSVINLETVNAYANNLTPLEILETVHKKLRKNYSGKKYYLQGFLRDRVYNTKDNKNTRLTESAIEIEKEEFANRKYEDKAEVVEIRNSYNYSKFSDNIFVQLKQRFLHEDENPIYVSLQHADYTSPQNLKILLKSDLYGFYDAGITMLDSIPVRIIEAKQNFVKVNFQKLSAGNNLYSITRFYIDMDSYAILKSEYFYVMNILKDKRLNYFVRNDTIGNYAVKQYEKNGDLYYLKYAGYYGKVFDQPSEHHDALYFNETDLLITRLITDKKEFDRIKRRNLLKKDISLWDMEYNYDEDFWRSYNILLDHPLDFKVEKDLEEQISLDEQFKNGNKNK